MFEVGKLYKNRGSSGQKIIEVLAVTQKYVIIKFLKWETDLPTEPLVGEERVWDHDTFYNWEEYTPPKVYTSELYVNLSWERDELYTTYREYENVDQVGRIRITYTKGQGLAVEVLS